MDNKEVIEELNKLIPNNPDYSNKNIALTMAIKYIEAWDEVKKEILSQGILKTRTNSYGNGFSDGLERAFGIINKNLKELEK